MSIKNIVGIVAGAIASGGIFFVGALIRETGRWLNDVCGFMDEQDELGGDRL